MDDLTVLLAVPVYIGALIITVIVITPVVMGIVVTVRKLGAGKGTLLLLSITFFLAYTENETLFHLFVFILFLLGVMEIIELLFSST